MEQSDMDLLRAILSESSEDLRDSRICALSDLELRRAVELLSDETVVKNVSLLEPLREECRRRGLTSTLKH